MENGKDNDSVAFFSVEHPIRETANECSAGSAVHPGVGQRISAYARYTRIDACHEILSEPDLLIFIPAEGHRQFRLCR